MTKAKSKFISSQEWSPELHFCKECVTGKSMTVEGESYTVKELFDRYMNGQVVNVERPAYYEDTKDFDAIDFDALRHADPFEKQILLEEVQAKAKVASDAIEKWKKSVDNQDKYNPDTGDFDDEDSPKSSKPKNQNQSGKRAGKEGDKERSDAEPSNSASDNP